MVNPSKIKGDRFEWDLVNDATVVLSPTELEIERTKAGSERDLGDLHIRPLGDRTVLAAVQAKNRRERKWAEWTDDAMHQAARAGARFGALFVKRVGVGSVLRSYAIMPVGEWLRMLATLHAAERVGDQLRTLHALDDERARCWRERAEAAEAELAQLRAQLAVTEPKRPCAECQWSDRCPWCRLPERPEATP